MERDEDSSLEIRVVLKGVQVERFEQIKEKLGISSRADVLRHLITIYPLPPPRFVHINTYDDHATVKDNVLNRNADVYFKNDGGVFCELCGLGECHHIDYVLSLPRVQRVLDGRGWKRKKT
jgi:hypothetical protein